MAKLVFLGRLEEVAGAAEIGVPLAKPTPLREVLAEFPPELVAALGSDKVRISLNGTLLRSDQRMADVVIADIDEIAFLPPVSGG